MIVLERYHPRLRAALDGKLPLQIRRARSDAGLDDHRDDAIAVYGHLDHGDVVRTIRSRMPPLSAEPVALIINLPRGAVNGTWPSSGRGGVCWMPVMAS